jgi:hypothetical protein
MGKIGPWRSMRISSAKVDFPRFMYCFGRFSALTQNFDFWHGPALLIDLDFWKSLNLLVLYEIGVE